MDVKLGWSGEIRGSWTKMDVEVDETDLALHFVDRGEDPEDLKYSPVEKFKLMYAIAEIFVLLHKMTKFPEVFNNEASGKELAELVQLRDKITQDILSRKAPF